MLILSNIAKLHDGASPTSRSIHAGVDVHLDSGRITEKSTQMADRLMRWTGFSPQRVARTCLDTLDRGGLYCMPQPDARIGWGIKRFTPTVYTRAVGLTTRVTT